MRCSAVCLWEETSPWAPVPPPRPRTARLLLAWRHNNQLQMCSGSPSASEVVLKVRVPPVVQGKFFREQPELSAASSEHRSCWQDILESKRRGLEVNVNILRSHPDRYRRGLRPHVKTCIIKWTFLCFLGFLATDLTLKFPLQVSVNCWWAAPICPFFMHITSKHHYWGNNEEIFISVRTLSDERIL